MQKREHLMLADWLTVFAYVDKNPHLTQTAVVDYTNGAAWSFIWGLFRSSLALSERSGSSGGI